MTGQQQRTGRQSSEAVNHNNLSYKNPCITLFFVCLFVCFVFIFCVVLVVGGRVGARGGGGGGGAITLSQPDES